MAENNPAADSQATGTRDAIIIIPGLARATNDESYESFEGLARRIMAAVDRGVLRQAI